MLTYTAGATTVALNHAVKVISASLYQPSATACTAQVTDLNGNLLLPAIAGGATAGTYYVPFAPAIMLPGGLNALGVVGATATINKFTVNVVGAGAILNLATR